MFDGRNTACGRELREEQTVNKLAGGGSVQLTLSLNYTTLTGIDQVMDHIGSNCHPPSSNTGHMHTHTTA